MVSKLLGGMVLGLVALFMLLGFVALERPLSPGVGVITLLLTVATPGVAGGVLIYRYFRDRGALARGREALRLQTYQSEILRLAAQRQGKVTVVEVTTETGIPSAEAEQALRSLVEQGVADVEITESGLLVYAVGDLQRLKDKDASRRLLDA